MPRAKIPEGELVNFIVKARYHANQNAGAEKNLNLIRNMVNRLYRDHVGYTLSGHHRLKAKGEPVFAAELARDQKRRGRRDGRPEVKSFLRYLGDGAFLWEGSRTLVLGIPPSALASVEQIDFVLADRFSPQMRPLLLELLERSRATLFGLPEVAAEAGLRGLLARELHVGGSLEEQAVSIHGVLAQSSSAAAALGFIVEMDGAVLYYTGRSALTSDMRLVGDLFKVDVLALPLGRSVPMSLWAATQAVDWVGPAWVLPWAAEEQVFPKDLQKHLGERARVKLLAPNERWELGG